MTNCIHKSKTSNTATGIHLTCLAVADSFILTSLFVYSTQQWAINIDIADLTSFSYIICTLPYYTANFSFLWSGPLLASATVERFVSEAYPLKVKTWNLYQISKMLMIVYFVGSLVLSSYSFLCFDIVPKKNGKNICAYAQQGFNDNVCTICDVIGNILLSNVVCVLLIFTFTLMIIIKLFKYGNNRSDLGPSGNTGKEFQITLMLVMVATLFQIMHVPEMISYQLMKYYIAYDVMNPILINLVTVYPIFVILLVINHSVNFIINIIFFGNFRRTFIGLFMEPIYLCSENFSN